MTTNNTRPSVKWFAEQMERKLSANDHKGQWQSCDAMWLLRRLKEETTELEEALLQAKFDAHELINEAADIANFAMMIADNARRSK